MPRNAICVASLRAPPIRFGPAKAPSKQTTYPREKCVGVIKRSCVRLPSQISHTKFGGFHESYLPSPEVSLPSFFPFHSFTSRTSGRRVVNPFYSSPGPARGIDVVKSFQQKPGRSFLSLFGVSCHSLTSTVRLSFTSTSSIEK